MKYEKVQGKMIDTITLIDLDQLTDWCQEKKICAACRKEQEPAAHVMITPKKGPFSQSMFLHFVICHDCYSLGHNAVRQRTVAEMDQGGTEAAAVKSAIQAYIKNIKLH